MLEIKNKTPDSTPSSTSYFLWIWKKNLYNFLACDDVVYFGYRCMRYFWFQCKISIIFFFFVYYIDIYLYVGFKLSLCILHIYIYERHYVWYTTNAKKYIQIFLLSLDIPNYTHFMRLQFEVKLMANLFRNRISFGYIIFFVHFLLLCNAGRTMSARLKILYPGEDFLPYIYRYYFFLHNKNIYVYTYIGICL